MRQPAPLVLVVTRSADTSALLCDELARAGYDPLVAAGGRAALRRAAEQPPAAIVVERALPDLDSEVLVRAMRQLPGFASLPAIALTSCDAPGSSTAASSYDHELTTPVDAAALAGLLRSAIPPGRAAHARPHVLLVHHEPQARRLAELCLRHAGYEVTEASTGAEAIGLARHGAPDAVVSEVLMPGLDGYELTLELRRDERAATMPIILTCAHLDPVDLELVTAVGANALVVETPDMGELVDAVRTRVRPSRRHETPPPTSDGDPILGHLRRLVRSNSEMRERLAAQSVELAFLAGFGIGIASGADPERLLDEVLGRCAQVTGFHCGAAYLALADGSMQLKGQVGFLDARPLHDFFGDAELLMDAIALAENGLARLPSDRLDGRRTHLLLHRAGMGVLLVAPVMDGDELLGALVLGTPQASTTSTQELLVAAIAAQVGRWLARVRTTTSLSRSQRRTVERLARAAEFRDEETANHTQRVSRYCALLARLSGIDDRRSELIAAASVMHDIGKLGIPDSILRKPGALTGGERHHMQQHADYGRKILAGECDPLLDLAAVIAWTHHERWDGSGYPRGLSGEEIPLEGRIVAIGDVFDALTSDRVYRPAMPVDQALEAMQAGRGTQFDPHLLDLFIRSLPQVLEIRRRHPDKRPVACLAPVG